MGQVRAPAPPHANAIETNLSYLIPICLVATLGGLLFGYDTGVISGAIEFLTARFHLSVLMKGWASGCVLIGCALGVLIVGPISDRFGRRPAMLLAAVFFVVSSLGTALPRDINTFILFRFLAGLAIGIASMSTPMYIAEIGPAHLRGRLVSLNQIAIVAGIVLVYFINYFIARFGDQSWNETNGWRLMFASGVLPAVVFAVFLVFIPESPRWLLANGQSEQAQGILAKIGGHVYAAAEITAIHTVLLAEKATWTELFSPALRRPLLVGILLAIFQQVTGINVFIYFGTTIFKNMSGSTGVEAGMLQQIIVGGASAAATLVAIATVDKWGRKPLMYLGTAGMGASLLAMGLMAQIIPNLDTVSRWMLLFIVLYVICFGLSVGPVTWVILSEIFPTAVRGRALGLATFFLWLADYAVTQTFPILDAPDSWFVRQFRHAFAFYLYASCCGLLMLVLRVMVPETKGKSLEQIEGAWRQY
ncbi:MAG TPA: sugar porter family MFS transporter [Candidatus Limnocylindrales bacterium]|jgi:sugar porter (SP) family MFS transporter|nr:sugar porter family MFS transporter [Candidatus Limnocylindrales bacterium]